MREEESKNTSLLPGWWWWQAYLQDTGFTWDWGEHHMYLYFYNISKIIPLYGPHTVVKVNNIESLDADDDDD